MRGAVGLEIGDACVLKMGRIWVDETCEESAVKEK